MDEIISMKPLIKIHIDEIIERLQENEKYFEEVQEELREFVCDKQFPIEDRFEVWSKWCKKQEHGWIIHESNVPVIGKWVDDQLFYMYEKRYCKFDWNYFFEQVEDAMNWKEGDYSSDSHRQIREDIKSLNEFKEILIETNFGSFIFDW